MTIIRNEASANQSDVNQVKIKLYGEPVLDYLAVFIKDPLRPTRYWYRRLNVVRRSENEQPVVDIGIIPMGEFDINPCPQEHLEVAVRNTCENEEEWGGMLQTDPDKKEYIDNRAVVGVAEYTGSKSIRFPDLVNLVGVKYSQMQEKHQISK